MWIPIDKFLTTWKTRKLATIKDKALRISILIELVSFQNGENELKSHTVLTLFYTSFGDANGFTYCISAIQMITNSMSCGVQFNEIYKYKQILVSNIDALAEYSSPRAVARECELNILVSYMNVAIFTLFKWIFCVKVQDDIHYIESSYLKITNE